MDTNKQSEEQCAQEETIPSQILGINDFQGALRTIGSFFDDKGNKTTNAGTASLLVGYLNRAQEQFEIANKGAQTIRDTEIFIAYIERKEAAGERIEASVDHRKRLVESATPINPEVPDSKEAEEKIKKATMFDPLYEDDELLRGVTLPNAKISLYDGEFPQINTRAVEIPKAELVGQAD